MAYSFRRIFFIGHNLNHVRNQYSFIFFPWTFDLLLISSSRYLLFGYLSQKYYIWIQTPKGTNHEIKTSIFTCFFHEIKTNIFTCFFIIKLKIPYEQSLFLFHEHFFRSSRSQMFFKIGALKDFAIFWIKKRLQQRCFSASLLIFQQIFYRPPPVAASVFLKVIKQIFCKGV